MCDVNCRHDVAQHFPDCQAASELPHRAAALKLTHALKMTDDVVSVRDDDFSVDSNDKSQPLGRRFSGSGVGVARFGPEPPGRDAVVGTRLNSEHTVPAARNGLVPQLANLPHSAAREPLRPPRSLR